MRRALIHAWGPSEPVVEIARQLALAGPLHVIDLLGSLPTETPGQLVHLPTQARVGRVRDLGLSAFDQFMARLPEQEIAPGLPIRSVLLDGFPLYWTTALAEKHDSFHWGRALFLLAGVGEVDEVTMADEVVVTLPDPRLERTADALLRTAGVDGARFECLAGATTVPSTGRVIRSLLGMVRRVLRFRPRVEGAIGARPAVFVLMSARIAPERHPLVPGIIRLASRAGRSAQVWLCPPWLDPSRPIPADLVSSGPSAAEVVRLAAAGVALSIRLGGLPPRDIWSDGVPFDGSLVLDEFQSCLATTAERLLCARWFGRALRRVDDGVVLFEDEFYATGRLLSRALSGSVRTVAVQHGLLAEAFTTYRISAAEVAAGLVLPDVFAVWGDGYARLIREMSPALEAVVCVLGHPGLAAAETHAPARAEHTARRILWCTTTASAAILEGRLLAESFQMISERVEFELLVREHPLHPVPDDQLEKVLGGMPFRRERSARLAEALGAVDAVLVSAFSSVVVEASAAGVPVLGLFPDSLGRAGGCTAASPAEVAEFLRNPVQDHEHNVVRDPSRWLDLFGEARGRVSVS